ncbi:HAD family phosphatase (plasmid) [Rhizobium sp. L51/94]|nr:MULTISPECIES: HAD family hydrolase [unclassified Rhizobium]QXZ81673.1 HAD family phosphatase [Rhizobium sp. L51/94]
MLKATDIENYINHYRLLLSDVDRTLLTEEYRIPRQVLEAVADIRRRGLKFVLATARSPLALRPYATLLQCTDLCICFNGAWIGSLDSMLAISEDPVPRKAALAVMDCIEELEMDALWYTNEGAFALRETPNIRREIDLTGEVLNLVSRNAELPGNPYKIMSIGADEEKRARVVDFNRNRARGVTFVQSSERNLEIIADTTSKGAASSNVRNFSSAMHRCGRR